MSRSLLPLAALLVAALVLVACGPDLKPPGAATPTPAIRVTPSPAGPTTSVVASPTAPTAAPTEALTEAPTVAPSPATLELGVEPFASGMPALTFLANAGDGTGTLYAVGQAGVITVVSNSGDVQSEPFLDVSDRITSGGERGLLGLAFHPDYESSGRFFVDYTNLDGDTVVSEFARANEAPTGALTAERSSERILLTIDQPYANHNGGMIAFGSDGYLYIGMGDGGSGGDPQGNGQNPQALLGKILRIDVDGDEPYAIPASNPFVADAGTRPEIWDLGVRNPWRFSFDRETGDLFIGDVGQNAQEEIDAEPAGQGGRNYGWNVMEGDRCFSNETCDETGLTLPAVINDRTRGECAIIGGYVYRGQQFPELRGTYVYSDSCSGGLWVLDAAAAIAQGHAETFQAGSVDPGPYSFGEDEAGELYVVNVRGEIYRLTSATR